VKKEETFVSNVFSESASVNLKIDLESNDDELSIINISIIITKIVTWNRISLFNSLRSTSSQVREHMLRDTLYKEYYRERLAFRSIDIAREKIYINVDSYKRVDRVVKRGLGYSL